MQPPAHLIDAALTPALQEKTTRLLEVLRGFGRVGVAFSAGVDSTVVAAAAARACGAKALAVTAISPSLPAGEADAAADLAARIGIRHEFLRTTEFADPNYTANPFNRCYFCKTELYTQLEASAAEWGVDVIVNGANVDDLGDYRPGLQAATEHAIRSPLVEAGFTKADVRELARAWELPVWDKPASPCLASRIAYGTAVTPERVARIDRAERWLRETFGLRELRVRLEANELARIEIPLEALPRLVDPAVRAELVRCFREWGFRAVTLDLEGFRSGSLNQIVPLVLLESPASGLAASTAQ